MLSSVFMLAPHYFVPQSTILDYDCSTTTICSSTAICRNALAAICNTASANCDTAAASCDTISVCESTSASRYTISVWGSISTGCDPTAPSCHRDKTAEKCDTAAESCDKTSTRCETTWRWGKATRRKERHDQDYSGTSWVGFSL